MAAEDDVTPADDDVTPADDDITPAEDATESVPETADEETEEVSASGVMNGSEQSPTGGKRPGG